MLKTGIMVFVEREEKYSQKQQETSLFSVCPQGVLGRGQKMVHIYVLGARETSTPLFLHVLSVRTLQGIQGPEVPLDPHSVTESFLCCLFGGLGAAGT